MYFNHVFHFLQLVPDSPSSPSSNHGEEEEKKRAMERTGKREKVERSRNQGEAGRGRDGGLISGPEVLSKINS